MHTRRSQDRHVSIYRAAVCLVTKCRIVGIARVVVASGEAEGAKRVSCRERPDLILRDVSGLIADPVNAATVKPPYETLLNLTELVTPSKSVEIAQIAGMGGISRPRSRPPASRTSIETEIVLGLALVGLTYVPNSELEMTDNSVASELVPPCPIAPVVPLNPASRSTGRQPATRSSDRISPQ